MDVSTEYIKMCDCPEIQPEVVEVLFMATPKQIFYIDQDVWFSELIGDKLHKVWLPRQDQLQEMVTKRTDGEDNLTSSQLIMCIEAWIFTSNVNPKYSMEQLWLAFVMKNKFNKVWHGQLWKHN